MASERERVIAVPSLYRLAPCTEHDDYVAGCAGCDEEILSSQLQNAYIKGYKAGVEAAAERLKKAAEAWATRQIDSEHEIAAVDFGPAQMLDDVLLPEPPACGS